MTFFSYFLLSISLRFGSTTITTIDSNIALNYVKVQYMIVVTCHASVYTLVLMSLDRFLAVVHPISSISFRTEYNALLLVKFSDNERGEI